MSRFLAATLLAFALCSSAIAQQADNEPPATKEDVQKYFEVMHSRDMVNKLVEAMLKPLHQMVHEQYMKDKDNLPPDCEDRMNQRMDAMLRDMPWDDMIQAEMPAFQKHLTKHDLESIVAFYSSPTGQKLLREMPTIMSEAMESMMPVMRKYIDSMNDRVQTEMAQMLKQSEKKSVGSPARQN